jgi:hypothetical protein
MNKLFILILITISFSTTAQPLSDRQQIVDTMEVFHQWDYTGKKEFAEKSLASSVKYHKIGKEGDHISYSVDFDWKGKGVDAYNSYITGLDIFGNIAIVKAIHYHQEKGQYVKVFILHKLKQGWRITSVAWGKYSPDA